MKIFYDIKNGLVWENYYFVPEYLDCEERAEILLKVLNGWSSKDLDRYVLNNAETRKEESIIEKIIDKIKRKKTNKKTLPLGVQLKGIVEMQNCLNEEFRTNLYFAFVKNGSESEPVGVVLLEDSSYRKIAQISCIVTNPKLTKRGYATKMIKSVVNNPKFFTGKDSYILLEAVIDKDNIKSINTFKKAGFVEDVQRFGEDSIYTSFKLADNEEVVEENLIK